jgi:hypothetical protein
MERTESVAARHSVRNFVPPFLTIAQAPGDIINTRGSARGRIPMNRTLAVLAVLLLAGGCANYYKVTDPTTGKVYYTKNLRERSSGSSTLVDGKTGHTVSLQNSEVQKITKDDYDRGRYATDETKAK